MYKLKVDEFESFNTFAKRSDIHDYHTRNNCNLNQTRNKRVFTDKMIRTTGPILWNSLDDKIRKSLLTNNFRNSYKPSVISSYDL